jgi:hypothetical protein
MTDFFGCMHDLWLDGRPEDTPQNCVDFWEKYAGVLNKCATECFLREKKE